MKNKFKTYTHLGRKKLAIILTIISVVISSLLFAVSEMSKVAKEKNLLDKNVQEEILRFEFRKQFSKSIDYANALWPQNVTVGDSRYEIEYTFDLDLQEKILQFLKNYKTNHTSVVVIDNESGNVLVAFDYTWEEKRVGLHYTFTATHPAASLFKIISTDALLAHDEVNLDTPFEYRGRGTTLYKYQLTDQKNRWTRTVDFAKAFAQSNNVVFGKAAQKYLDDGELFKTAYRWGFNQELFQEMDLTPSIYLRAEGDYNMAEKASGFNRTTTLSPLHGALLSSIVANQGELIYPQVIKKIIPLEKAQNISFPIKRQSVTTPQKAQELQELMTGVVQVGTARNISRHLPNFVKENVLIGGKTGRISGGLPEGVRDWFSAFAMPKSKENKGISVCVMNINGKKWYIKSSYIAKKIIEYYYERLYKNKNRISHNEE